MPPNRIEVDLKLLQDKNLQKLTEFGQQFDKSVETLASVLKDYTDQIASIISGQNVSPTGGVSPNASDARNVRIDSLGQARLGQTEDSFSNKPASAYGDNGGASTAQQTDQMMNSNRGVSGGGSAADNRGGLGFEQDYVRALRRIGSGREGIPVGLRQWSGYMAEGQLPWQKPVYQLPDGSRSLEPLGPDGQALPRAFNDDGSPAYTGGQVIARRINDSLSMGQSVAANVSLANQHLNSARNFILSNTLFGENLGYSRAGGLFGGAFMSPAFNAAVSNQYQAMRLANFGLDLNYSPAQARQATQAMTNYGWSGDSMYSWLGNFIKHQQNAGFTPDFVMSMMDTNLRFGGTENLDQIHETFNAIAAAAKAANIPLNEMQQQIQGVATAVNQVTGQTPISTANELAAFTSVTGLAPERAQGLLENPQNYLMASAMTGKSIWDLTAGGRGSMAAMQQFGLLQFTRSIGGVSVQQLNTALKAPKNSAQYQAANQALSRAEWLYMQNPEIFGGLSPKDWLNQGNRAGSWQGILRRENVMQTLGNADVSRNIDFHHLIQQYAGGNSKYAYSLETEMSRQYNKWMQGGAMVRGHSYLGNTREDLIQQRKERVDWLLHRLNGENQKHARQAAAKVTIVLSGTAKKYFRLLNSEYGKGGHTNGGGNVWTSIEDYARDAMPYLGDAASAIPGVGGMISGIGSAIGGI